MTIFFSLLNDEQMSNWLGVEHQPDRNLPSLKLTILAHENRSGPKRKLISLPIIHFSGAINVSFRE